MSRLFLLRFSFLNIKNLINSKIGFLINLSIFVIIFALSASFISILFENRIEQLETKVTRNEVNQILYTKWLNRSPKIIIQINNVYKSRKNETLFTDIIRDLPAVSSIYSKREEFMNYYYFISDVAEINFKNMDLAITDALLLSNSEKDLKLIEDQKLEFSKLILKFDNNRANRMKYTLKNEELIDSDRDLYYRGFDEFIKINTEIINSQRLFFLEFVSKYFSDKRLSYTSENLEHLKEIKDLADLETKFVFFAFMIQFIIFIILQVFEVTVERDRKNEKS